MQLSKNFIFSHDVLHVLWKFIVFFGQFVKLIVGNHGLFADFFCIDKEWRVFVFFRHFPESGRELSDGGIFVSVLFDEFLVEELLSFEFLAKIFELIDWVGVFFLKFGFHGFDIFGNDFIDIFDLFSCNKEFGMVFVSFLR